MELQETRSIILFDKFKLSIPKNLTFHQDGDDVEPVLKNLLECVTVNK